MLKKETSELVQLIRNAEEYVETVLAKHLDEYSEYGMDDIANDLIGVQATLEVVRLKAQYAMVKGDRQ